MPLSLITPGKLSPTDVTGKGLLSRVSTDVSGEVVTSAEISHADAALEGLLACVDSDMASQLIGTRKAPVTGLHRAGVGALVGGGLAGPVRVLAHSTWLDKLRLISGVEGLQILGASLCGKSFDGRERGEGRLGSALQTWKGFLVWWDQAQLTLLLWEQIVWNYGHLEAALGSGISRWWVLES